MSKANIKSRSSYYCLSKQEYRQFLQSSIDVKTSYKQDVAYKGKIKDCQSTRKLNVNNTWPQSGPNGKPSIKITM